MIHTYTVTVTSDSEPAELLDDVLWLLRDAANGYVGEPDRPLGGATIEVVAVTA